MKRLRHHHALFGAAGLLVLGGAILLGIRLSGPKPAPAEPAAAIAALAVSKTAAEPADAPGVAEFPAALPAFPPDSQPSALAPADSPPPEEPPGASEPALGSGDSPPDTLGADHPTEYDVRLTVMVGIVQTVRASGSEAGKHVPVLLASSIPMEQASGLALMAGLEMSDVPHDLSTYAPEVVLASVDLCGALFGDASAQALLAEWTESMGGARPAGELAHSLLLESQLPYGGGSAALDLMARVNDPQATWVGLRLVAADAGLPAATRTEALLRLRDHMGFQAYRDFVRASVDRARQAGDAWASRAVRLLERLEGPPEVMSGPQRVNPAFIDNALSRSDSGDIEDLELYLRREIPTGRVLMDAEAKAYFRESLADLDEAGLAGPDLAALQRLRRQLGSEPSQP